MLHKLRRWLFNHFRDNFLIYFIVTVLFCIGIIIGAVTIKVMESERINSIMQFVNGLFKSINSSDINNVSVLKQSLIDNFKAILLVWISSALIVGVILVPAIILFKGFALGFSVGFFVNEFGFKGFLFSVLGIFSQNLFIIPGIIAISSIGLAFSINNIRKKKIRVKSNAFISEFINSSSFIALFSVFVFIGCLIEAYLTPVFMKFFIDYLG
ncbi:MAG: stage II sporulation protein M [Tissierellia bacterium]|nr:stage II sporulation protein M [Tissierellia bacterium]